MSEFVVLFGNGLSIGVSPAFAVPAMTTRLNERLDLALREALAELRAVATPDEAVPPEAVLGFEQLAGPLDRVANAIAVLSPLARHAAQGDCLRESHEFLRRRYLSLVGLVLRDISESARLGDANGWERLNQLAVALRDLHATASAAVFTLSYDTLLDSAMIETRAGWFYDGFAGLRLNYPLDRWQGTLPLYHLHGSVLWYEAPNGTIAKARSGDPLHEELLASWAEGQDELGFPVVVLTDAKIPAVARHPVDLFYQELWRELSNARVFVVAGYAFADEPVNSVIRRWLGVRAPNRRLEVWSHAPDRARRRFEERIADIDATGDTGPAIGFPEVVLPDSERLHGLAG